MADNIKIWEVSSVYIPFTFSITYLYTHSIIVLSTCYQLSSVFAVFGGYKDE